MSLGCASKVPITIWEKDVVIGGPFPIVVAYVPRRWHVHVERKISWMPIFCAWMLSMARSARSSVGEVFFSSRISWGLNQSPHCSDTPRMEWILMNNCKTWKEKAEKTIKNMGADQKLAPTGENWPKKVRRTSMRAPAHVGTARCAKTPWHWKTVTSWTKLNDSRDQNDVRMMKCSSTSGYTRKITRIMINFSNTPIPLKWGGPVLNEGCLFFCIRGKWLETRHLTSLGSTEPNVNPIILIWAPLKSGASQPWHFLTLERSDFKDFQRNSWFWRSEHVGFPLQHLSFVQGSAVDLAVGAALRMFYTDESKSNCRHWTVPRRRPVP